MTEHNNKVLHPEYELLIEDYFLMRTSFKGQRAIKEAGDTFLSPTSGMRIDGYPSANPGLAAYDAYKERAIYHSYVRETIQSLLGTMYTKSPTFELPASINFMLESATPEDEPLQILLQRINQEQLFVGRVGLLVDVGAEGGNPYITTYAAETILDWDTSIVNGQRQLHYICLDETGFVRTDRGWKLIQSFRVLALRDGVYQMAVTDSFDNENFEWVTPLAKGKPLTEIPFTFVNSTDLASCPPIPPLIDLANLSISIYRASADYNQSLFHQAQPTLVRIGAEGMNVNDKNTARTGAGAIVDLPTGGTLEYVEVGGAGLAEMRTALDTNKAKASIFTSDFLRSGGANASGESLRVRLESAASTLKNVATTGAFGLEKALTHCLLFAGGTGFPKVSPNLDFQKEQLVASELKVLQDAKLAGAPISASQINKYMRDMDFTELDLKETEVEIAAETKDIDNQDETL